MGFVHRGKKHRAGTQRKVHRVRELHRPWAQREGRKDHAREDGSSPDS